MLNDIILELYEKEFNPLKMTEEECPGFQIEYFPVLLFLSSSLTRYKEAVLEAIPEKEEKLNCSDYGKGYEDGFNVGVQQFKDNINNI